MSGLATERNIDRGVLPNSLDPKSVRTLASIIDLHIRDHKEVGKPIRRSKSNVLEALRISLGDTRIHDLKRSKLIEYGKHRAKEGAGPATLSIGLSLLGTLLTHAAAVHGIAVYPEEVKLARVALSRLGLVGKGVERDRRPTQDELTRDVTAENSSSKWPSYLGAKQYPNLALRHPPTRAKAGKCRSQLAGAACSNARWRGGRIEHAGRKMSTATPHLILAIHSTWALKSRRVIRTDAAALAFHASDLAHVLASELQSHARAHPIRFPDNDHAIVLQPAAHGLRILFGLNPCTATPLNETHALNGKPSGRGEICLTDAG
jgi:hypothetical protein